MSNRLRKLAAEEDRLNRQIAIANKKAEFADQVAKRRATDNRIKGAHAYNVEEERILQNQKNRMAKTTMEDNIHKNRGRVQ